jgi:hypothetical protein
MSFASFIVSIIGTLLHPFLVGVAQLHLGTPAFEAETKGC